MYRTTVPYFPEITWAFMQLHRHSPSAEQGQWSLSGQDMQVSIAQQSGTWPIAVTTWQRFAPWGLDSLSVLSTDFCTECSKRQKHQRRLYQHKRIQHFHITLYDWRLRNFWAFGAYHIGLYKCSNINKIIFIRYALHNYQLCDHILYDKVCQDVTEKFRNISDGES